MRDDFPEIPCGEESNAAGMKESDVDVDVEWSSGPALVRKISVRVVRSAGTKIGARVRFGHK
jgi:hypothetical protein